VELADIPLFADIQKREVDAEKEPLIRKTCCQWPHKCGGSNSIPSKHQTF